MAPGNNDLPAATRDMLSAEGQDCRNPTTMPPSPEQDTTAKMRRLTATELSAYKTRLSSWLRLDQVNLIMAEIGEQSQFYAVSQGGLKFWREAFVGMSCAYLTHADRFRLGADPPDFELAYGKRRQGFELLQVMPKGWRLGDEYNTYADELNEFGSTKLKSRSYRERQTESETVVDDVRELLQAKVAKKYDNRLILVIDIFHDLYFSTDSGHVRVLSRVAQQGLSSFSEVWLRQANHIVRVSQNSVSMISEAWPSDT